MVGTRVPFVVFYSDVLNEDRPLTLEQVMLKNFKYSTNPDDKLYNQDKLLL